MSVGWSILCIVLLSTLCELHNPIIGSSAIFPPPGRIARDRGKDLRFQSRIPWRREAGRFGVRKLEASRAEL